MKFLLLSTDSYGLRSEVVGSGAEDSNLYVSNKPIGFTPGLKVPIYGTPLEAIADGWHLMAPPTPEKPLPNSPVYDDMWTWWFTKER